jgi:hypothetical protein
MPTFTRINPTERLFPSQLADEMVVIVVREHWFRLFSKVLLIAVLSLLPVVFKLLLVDTQFLNTSNTAGAIVSSISAVYYLSLLVALFVVFVLYYLNLHIVSENRIVDIDQTGILFHEVSELNIETIEDVSSETKGLIGNLLNYGTVHIQTAGAKERFEFDNVPHPENIAKVILELYEAHGKKEQPKP